MAQSGAGRLRRRARRALARLPKPPHRVAPSPPPAMRPPCAPPHAQALAAQAVKVEPQVEVIPEIKVDLFGAVSPVSAGDVQEGVFK